MRPEKYPRRCLQCGQPHETGREAIECDHRHGRHAAAPAQGCNFCGTLR